MPFAVTKADLCGDLSLGDSLDVLTFGAVEVLTRLVDHHPLSPCPKRPFETSARWAYADLLAEYLLALIESEKENERLIEAAGRLVKKEKELLARGRQAAESAGDADRGF